MCDGQLEPIGWRIRIPLPSHIPANGEEVEPKPPNTMTGMIGKAAGVRYSSVHAYQGKQYGFGDRRAAGKAVYW